MARDVRFWLVVAVVFFLGIAAGAGLNALVLGGSRRANAGAGTTTPDPRIADLESRLASLTAENESLTSAKVNLEEQVALLSKVSGAQKAPGGETGGEGDTEKPAAAPVVTARSVDPAEVTPGEYMWLVVKVKGDADKVGMRLINRDDPGAYDKSFFLTETSSSGEVHTWKKKIRAPSVTGEYRFYASAFWDGKHVEMPGISAWTFLVENP